MIENGAIDRTGWEDGPWASEPDQLSWRDKTTGLSCLIIRNEMGILCGYVGVGGSHPLHGRDYSSTGIDGISVHGGLTFSGLRIFYAQDDVISKVLALIKQFNVWWFGFDCGHCFDILPAFSALGMPSFGDRCAYRDIEYVRQEVTNLAQQLAVQARIRSRDEVDNQP